MWGLGRGIFWFLFFEDDAIVKKEVENHDDERGETEDTGGLDKIIIEG